MAQYHLGEGAARTGRALEAVSLLESALKMFTDINPSSCLRLFALIGLAEAHAYAGHYEQARRCVDEVLDWARERSKAGWELAAHHALGLAAVSAGSAQFAAAERHLDQAFALAQEYRRRPLIARCHLDLAQLDRRAGRNERARAHLCHATAMFGEMGMRFWIERAEAERRQLEVA